MRVLVIEDNDVDVQLVERALGDQFTLRRTRTLAAGLKLAEAEPFDLVILDLTLDDSHGYETFEKARAALTRVPIMVLSGIDDEELALRAVSNGAQDYVQKSRLLDEPLDRAARYAIERRRVEEAARKTEQQYRTLFDNLPTPAYTCDADGLITYYNEKAVELWGRAPRLNDPRDRFCGSFALFAPDGTPVPHDQCWMAQALRERRGFNGREIVIGLPSGERRVAVAHANPVLDESGTLRGGIKVLVDVSPQLRAEREARESERFALATVNSLAAHIAILDHAGTILSGNAAWNRFADENGMTAGGHAVGANYLTVCERASDGGDEVARAAADGIRSVLRGERHDFCLEYPCHSPTEERWFLMRATPFDGDGPRRVVVSHENITARRVAERLEREKSGLRDAVQSMEQVLGIVGHELRTPLAALGAISEFLLTDGAKDTAEWDRFLGDMASEVDRMSDTVNNLLEAARLNSGRARWNWGGVDVCEICREAVDVVRPLVDPARVDLSLKVDADARACQILGDGEALRRLVTNLLSNARKHTADGSIQVIVRGSCGGGGCCGGPTGISPAWVEVAVSDTGTGIPAEILQRVGEAFALNSGVVGANYVSGTGLGLAICKGIVAAHGGELLVESAPGQGTTITARLRADLPAAAEGDTVHLCHTEEIAA